MVERYAREEMSSKWTQQARYAAWLEVEKAAVKAWNKIGLIPDEDAEKIVKNATFSLLISLLKKTISFLRLLLCSLKYDSEINLEPEIAVDTFFANQILIPWSKNKSENTVTKIDGIKVINPKITLN